MLRLTAITGLALGMALASPAWAACPTVITDCTGSPIAQNYTAWSTLKAGSSTTQGIVQIDGTAAQQRDLRFSTAGVSRWSIQGHNGTEPGNNAGTDLWIRSLSDTGATIGQVLQASRASGNFGDGLPYFNYLGAFQQTVPRLTTPGGVVGNLIDYTAGMDTQPTYTLAANPLATTSGSAVVNISWPNSGPMFPSNRDVWVLIGGATAVGGITPAGWYKGTFVDANTFSITHTASATSTATGGGAAVTVRPSFGVQGAKTSFNVTTGVNGFPEGTTEYYFANPEFFSTTSNGPRYQRRFTQGYSPNDTTQSHAWQFVDYEANYMNRGADEGYQPILGAATRATTGMYGVALNGLLLGTIGPGGGTGTNLTAWFDCVGAPLGSGPGTAAAWYQCYTAQPNSLVGMLNDPKGHGGVGYEVFGSYENMPTSPFTVSVGSSVVTVRVFNSSGLSTMVNGDKVFIYGVQTLNGVTFGNQVYTLAGVDNTAHTFQITGTGSAGASGSGGGAGQTLSFGRYVPHSPMQVGGEFLHGLTANKVSRFDDGLVVNAPPGAGIGWTENPDTSNVTSSSTASVTGNLLSPGNIEVTLTAAGTATVRAASPLRLKSFTVALLPTCNAGLEGAMVEVSDATAPTYNGALTGGGAVKIPAFCNGTAWTAH